MENKRHDLNVLPQWARRHIDQLTQLNEFLESQNRAYQDGAEATADAFIEAGKEIAAREIIYLIKTHNNQNRMGIGSDEPVTAFIKQRFNL